MTADAPHTVNQVLSVLDSSMLHAQAEARAKQLAGQIHGLEEHAKARKAYADEMHAKLAAAEACLASQQLVSASEGSGNSDMRDATRQVLLAQVRALQEQHAVQCGPTQRMHSLLAKVCSICTEAAFTGEGLQVRTCRRTIDDVQPVAVCACMCLCIFHFMRQPLCMLSMCPTQVPWPHFHHTFPGQSSCSRCA